MMHYSEIVAEGSLDALKAIADEIATRLNVRVLKAPSPGMVMVRHVDPLEKTGFLVGEAYVTECEVEVEGRLGYGCVIGSADERALCGALVDAVFGGMSARDSGGLRGPVSHTIALDLEPLLDAERVRIEARWDAESRAVASTRVNFEVR
jgi:phosphonate C-P lyase system protein PhnG